MAEETICLKKKKSSPSAPPRETFLPGTASGFGLSSYSLLFHLVGPANTAESRQFASCVAALLGSSGVLVPLAASLIVLGHR